MSTKKKKKTVASGTAPTNKRKAAGLERLINSLSVAAARVENVAKRLKLWGLDTTEADSARTGIDDMAASLQKLTKDGWEPPARSALKIEAGSTVKIIKAQRAAYAEAFDVVERDLENLEVVKISDAGKRVKILVRTESGAQFPVPKRHLAVVADTEAESE